MVDIGATETYLRFCCATIRNVVSRQGCSVARVGQIVSRNVGETNATEIITGGKAVNSQIPAGETGLSFVINIGQVYIIVLAGAVFHIVAHEASVMGPGITPKIASFRLPTYSRSETS